MVSRKSQSILMAIGFIVTAACAWALPDNEPFNYTAGANLIGQTTPDSLVWTAAGAGTSQISVSSGNLSTFGLATSTGNSIQIPAGSGPSARMPIGFTVTSGTIYYSFLFRVSDLTALSTNGSHAAGFNNSVGTQTQIPTSVATRLLLRSTGTGGYNIGLGKASTTTTDWTWSSSFFTTNDTVFVVGSYTFNTGSSSDDVAKLWIDPDPNDFGSTNPASLPLVASSGADIPSSQIASFIFFQRTGGVQPLLTIGR